jgi:hypothetical protein
LHEKGELHANIGYFFIMALATYKEIKIRYWIKFFPMFLLFICSKLDQTSNCVYQFQYPKGFVSTLLAFIFQMITKKHLMKDNIKGKYQSH